jgi:hypothetical protein
MTTRSLLGAIVYETGGILVGDGLLRLFGSGMQRSLLDCNRSARLLGNDADAHALLGCTHRPDCGLATVRV